MSSDKRTVHTDALDTLGMLLDNTAKRDAIHLAVEPVLAGETLTPGTYVEVNNGVAFTCRRSNAVGIVDPFLETLAVKGDRFWLYLKPRTIKSLRHVWEHPAFPSEEFVCENNEYVNAVALITNFAESINSNFDEVLRHARYYVEYGEFWSEGGRFEGQGIPEDFWEAFETITGLKVPEDDKYSFFSCSC